MLTGLLTFWNRDRAFGFIRTEQRETFVLHITAITEGPLIPTVGSVVEFEVQPPLPGKKLPNTANAKITVGGGK